MRATALFFGYLLLCLLLAALLIHPLMQTGWIDQEPQRVLGRLAQIFILLGLWPFLKALRLANRPALALGVSGRTLARTVALGWVQGVMILLALVLALVLLEIRLPAPSPGSWTTTGIKVVQALLGGLLIGLLEETFFRGALYTAIRRRDGLASAVFWSALLYAALHFLKPGALPTGMAFDGAGVRWMLAHVFIDAVQWKNLDSFCALVLVGVFLALVRERTGHIGWCIGLHAGWVFVIQVTRRFTDGNDSASLAFLAGDYDGTIGWLAAAWIGLLSWVYWTLTRQKSS